MQLLGIRCGVSKLGERLFDRCLYQRYSCHSNLRCACVCVKRYVIEQQSTNQIHPAEIPRSTNFYVCKCTRPSSRVRGSGTETSAWVPPAEGDDLGELYKLAVNDLKASQVWKNHQCSSVAVEHVALNS